MNWKQSLSLGLCSVGAYAEQWETLYEGDVRFQRDSGREDSYGGQFGYTLPIYIGETYRLTVDNSVYTGVGKRASGNNSARCFGNEIYKYEETGIDTGEDYLCYVPMSSAGELYTVFMVHVKKDPGTYTVKIERKL